ncbi:MAG TPA: apolipoprotein N-acyltransferase [Streptosporangiaceae bacterium]|nr:apolipoprotein N-acyltransferase [Streptosporangiaceae bacterium]
MAILRGLRKPVRYAALLSGALPVLAFPEPNLEFLAWFGLVPGMLLMRAAPSLREAVAAGWWFGTGFLLAALYWLAPEIGPGLLLVAVVVGALWTGVAAAIWKLLYGPVNPRRALAALVVVPSYWLVIEWIRSWQALGGPWAVLGVSQWQHPAILALAAIGGVWLVSFAIVAANTGIVILLAGRGVGLRVLGGLATAVVIAAGPVAFALTAPAPRAGQVTVALVQPGIQRDTPRTGASQRLTEAITGHPDLIVWGESSVGYLTPALLTELRSLSAARNAEILADSDSLRDGKKTKVAVLIAATGITGEYTKTRLVPFGEYIPFRQQLSWLTSISKAAPVNMTPGTGAHDLRAALPDGRPLSIGVLICFESAFPDMSRVDTDHGARVIVYQTSDSTFSGTWALAQHASLGALRAAETGRPVIQAALTGDSVAFDARGRLLSWFGPSRTGVDIVRLSLPTATARTPFDRLGDYVPWTAVGIALAFAIAVACRPGSPGLSRRISFARGHRAAAAASSPADAPKSGVMAGRDQDETV